MTEIRFGWMDDDDENEEAKINAPASAKSIADLEAELSFTLPNSVKSMYAVSDGVDPSAASLFAFRLMTLKEVRTISHSLQQSGFGRLMKKYSMHLFWTDDSSNYAGVYCGGPFDGRVFFLDHDGSYTGDLSALFRSVTTFEAGNLELIERNNCIHKWENGDLDKVELDRVMENWPAYRYYDSTAEAMWHAMPADYRSGVYGYGNEDRKAFEECQRRLKNADFESEDEHRLLAVSLARFVPLNEVTVLTPFLDHESVWLAENVAKVIAMRECMQMLPALVKMAESDTHARRSAGRCILAKLAFAEVAYGAKISSLVADKSKLETDIAALRESPTLYYQW